MWFSASRSALSGSIFILAYGYVVELRGRQVFREHLLPKSRQVESGALERTLSVDDVNRSAREIATAVDGLIGIDLDRARTARFGSHACFMRVGSHDRCLRRAAGRNREHGEN